MTNDDIRKITEGARHETVIKQGIYVAGVSTDKCLHYSKGYKSKRAKSPFIIDKPEKG